MIMVDEKALAAPPPAYDHIGEDGSQQIMQSPQVSQLPQGSGGYPPAPYPLVTLAPATAQTPGSPTSLTQQHETVLNAPALPQISLGAQYQQHRA